MKERVAAEKRPAAAPPLPPPFAPRHGGMETRLKKSPSGSECLRVLLIKGRGGGEAAEEWAGQLSS